jgi:hypothetical protein
MNGKTGRSRLSGKPRVRELREASGREKALALVGLGLALVLALMALLWGRSSGALSGAAPEAGPLVIPTADRALGLGLLLAGLTVLLFGWPLYRLTAILTGILIGGGVAGALGWLAAGDTGALVGGLLGALVGGLAAWPTEVLIRTLTGAMVGLVLGMMAGNCIGGAGALIGCGVGGLLLGGALTFLFYRSLIIAYSAILGALTAVYGVLCVWRPLSEVEPRALLMGAAAGLAVAGIFVQRTLGRKDAEQNG